MNGLIMMLAQTTTGAPAGGAPGNPQSGAGSMLFLAIMGAFLVFIFMTSRSQRKREQQQKDELMAGLSKNDRVLTVGGIVGTILSVKDNEVVLKVDESTNTKMTFLRTAIQRKYGEDAKE